MPKMLLIQLLEKAKELGMEMVKTKLILSSMSRKAGDKVMEDEYWSDACRINRKLIKIQAELQVLSAN